MKIDPKSYEALLDMPRPQSHRHAPMSRAARAAQFSPFAALSGYDEMIEESLKEWQDRERELDGYCDMPSHC